MGERRKVSAKVDISSNRAFRSRGKGENETKIHSSHPTEVLFDGAITTSPDLLAHVDILLPSPGCALLSNHTSLAPLPVDVENLSLLCASPPLVREFFSFLLGCVFRHAYQHTHTRCARSLRRRARLFHVSVCACDVTRNSRLPFTPRAALPQFLSSSPFAHRLSLSTGC